MTAPLTPQEKHLILSLRGKGLTYGQIGERLDIPVNTVKSVCRREAEKSCAAATAASRSRSAAKAGLGRSAARIAGSSGGRNTPIRSTAAPTIG